MTRRTDAAACGCGSRGESHVAVAGGMRAFAFGRKQGKTGGGARSALQPGVMLCYCIVITLWRKVGGVRPLRPACSGTWRRVGPKGVA